MRDKIGLSDCCTGEVTAYRLQKNKKPEKVAQTNNAITTRFFLEAYFHFLYCDSRSAWISPGSLGTYWDDNPRPVPSEGFGMEITEDGTRASNREFWICNSNVDFEDNSKPWVKLNSENNIIYNEQTDNSFNYDLFEYDRIENEATLCHEFDVNTFQGEVSVIARGVDNWYEKDGEEYIITSMKAQFPTSITIEEDQGLRIFWKVKIDIPIPWLE